VCGKPSTAKGGGEGKGGGGERETRTCRVVQGVHGGSMGEEAYLRSAVVLSRDHLLHSRPHLSKQRREGARAGRSEAKGRRGKGSPLVGKEGYMYCHHPSPAITFSSQAGPWTASRAEGGWGWGAARGMCNTDVFWIRMHRMRRWHPLAKHSRNFHLFRVPSLLVDVMTRNLQCDVMTCSLQCYRASPP